MKLKIESSEFTIEELLHHIGKGRGSHLKAVIIEQIKAAQQRIAELEATQEQSIQRSAFVEKRLIERADAAEAELARRDAAAGEPVILRPFGESSQKTFVRCDENHPFAVKLYTYAQPSALPPEMLMSDAVKANVTTDFMDGANWMRERVKELGCKAIKLPAGTVVNGFPMVITQEIINYLHHQGFTVEGE